MSTLVFRECTQPVDVGSKASVFFWAAFFRDYIVDISQGSKQNIPLGPQKQEHFLLKHALPKTNGWIPKMMLWKR